MMATHSFRPQYVRYLKQVFSLTVYRRHSSVAKLFANDNRTRTCKYLSHLQTLKWNWSLTRNPNQKIKSNAAVLVPLCDFNGEPSILLTLRSFKVGSGKGELSFPGGMCDVDDASVVETALRETYEEVGIPPERVDVWSSMIPYVDQWGRAVTPVIGHVRDISLESLNQNQDEVSQVLAIPIRHLCDDENKGRTTYRVGKLYKARKGALMKTPVFKPDPMCERYPADDHGFTGQNIWGTSAVILDAVLGILAPSDHQWLRPLLPSVEVVENS